MAMYAISTSPLINTISNKSSKQAWYADDASTPGEIQGLRHWWDHLVQIGPDYGYYPNATNTWLTVKEEIFPLAQTILEGTECPSLRNACDTLKQQLGLILSKKLMSGRKSLNGFRM